MEIIFETADCEKVQATTVIFRENWAYLKINSLVKTPLHEFMAVARSGLWAPARGCVVLGTAYSDLYREGSPGKGTFFRRQVYARVGFH